MNLFQQILQIKADALARWRYLTLFRLARSLHRKILKLNLVLDAEVSRLQLPLVWYAYRVKTEGILTHDQKVEEISLCWVKDQQFVTRNLPAPLPQFTLTKPEEKKL